MKKTRLFLFGIALTALAGCALFSLNPFYTPQNRIGVPLEARGLWSGDRLHLKILPDGTVEYRSFAGEKTVELELQAVFFKVADSLTRIFPWPNRRRTSKTRCCSARWSPRTMCIK